jgi:hypothetical protein
MLLLTALILTCLVPFAVEAQTVTKKVYTTARLAGVPPSIDGRLTDESWSAVDWASEFVQSVPAEGAAPAERTSFKVLYDNAYLYVAIRLHDSDPARIERMLGRRDNFSGDGVVVAFDSYHDQRTAFGFGVNAAGVKWDAVTANDVVGWDATWDPVWDVATAIDAEGWTAELRIPFNQLRFADTDEHVWGLEVSRQLFRKQEESNWQPLSRRVAGYASRFGELRGIKGIRPKTPVEVVPYGVGQMQRSQSQSGNPFATGQRSKVTGGLDWLEANLASVGGAGAAEVDLGQIAVACALGYLDFRFADMDWRTARPRLSGWFKEFSQRASMQRTMPSA